MDSQTNKKSISDIAAGSSKSGAGKSKKKIPIVEVSVPKPITTLEDALERIAELELQIKKLEEKKKETLVKHKKKLENVKEDCNAAIKKMEDKQSELNKKLRQRNYVIKKDQAGMEEMLTIIDRARRGVSPALNK